VSSISHACRPTVPALERDFDDGKAASDGTTTERGTTGAEGSRSSDTGSSGTSSVVIEVRSLLRQTSAPKGLPAPPPVRVEAEPAEPAESAHSGSPPP